MKVLIIDDDPAIRAIAAAFMARGGMTVVQAGSGEEGIALAGRERPDAIVLDVVMPGIDGPATLEALRAQSASAAIPVIFMTATRDEDELRQLHALGVRGIIRKPFAPPALAAEIRALLEAPPA